MESFHFRSTISGKMDRSNDSPSFLPRFKNSFESAKTCALACPSKFHVPGCGFLDLGGRERERRAIFSQAQVSSAQITPLGDVSPRKRPFCSHIFYLIAGRLSCIALIRGGGERGLWNNPRHRLTPNHNRAYFSLPSSPLLPPPILPFPSLDRDASRSFLHYHFLSNSFKLIISRDDDQS